MLAAIAALAVATAPALAGKLGQKLDQESEKSKDIGIRVSASSTPAKKFTLKVNMNRKVDINVFINTSCTKPDGKTSVNKQLNFSQRGSFKKAFNAKPAKTASARPELSSTQTCYRNGSRSRRSSFIRAEIPATIDPPLGERLEDHESCLA
jgi:hypothetical protein